MAVKLAGSDSTLATQLQQWTNFVGQPPVHLLTFGSMEGWSSNLGEFIWASGLLRWTKAGIPVVASIPMCPNNGLLSEVISGKRDTEFRRAATTLAGKIKWLRIGWEANKGFPWTRNVTDSQYMEAWNRITDIFLSVSQDFRLICNFLADPHDGQAFLGRIPQKNLHCLSLDLYYYPEFTNTNPATAFAQYRDGKVGLEAIRKAADDRGLPWALDEWGVRENQGAFVDLVADYLEAHPAAWHCWWDDQAIYDSRISDGKAGSTGERFKVRFRPKPVDPRIAELEAKVAQLQNAYDLAISDLSVSKQENEALTTRLAEALSRLTEATKRAEDTEGRIAHLKSLWSDLNRNLAP
jgi:hypothetical protein